MADVRNPSFAGGVEIKPPAKIRDSNELRNINSYEYLLEIYNALDVICKKYPGKVIPPALAPLNKIYEMFHMGMPFYEERMNPGYGDLYTEYLLGIENNLSNVKNYIDQLPDNDDKKFLIAIHDAGIKAIYANPNLALERAGEMVKDLNGPAIKGRMKFPLKDDEYASGTVEIKNATSPTEAGSTMGLLRAMLAPDFKPQSTTSQASIRSYHYIEATKEKIKKRNEEIEQKNLIIDAENKKPDVKKQKPLLPEPQLPQEIRFGTQGQRVNYKPRVSPMFEKFLEIQQTENPSQIITHVYFNNLKRDQRINPAKRFEAGLECDLTSQLEDLGKRHPNIAVITLPADGGLMSHHAFKKHQQDISTNTAYQRMLNIAKGVATPDTERYRDFYISDNVKRLLYGAKRVDGKSVVDTANEEKILKHLLDNSFAKLGIDKNRKETLSTAEMQAVYFHFIKFELTNYILLKLNPVSFNMSCKDAIDRGGISSAYYNLMKSLESGMPLSEDEFHRALHAAPSAVKGRAMNDHINLIWNAVDAYLNNPANKCPEWMVIWRNENAPEGSKHTHLAELDSYIATVQLEKEQGKDVELKAIKESAAIQLKALATYPNKSIPVDENQMKALNNGRLKDIFSNLKKNGLVNEKNIQVMPVSPKAGKSLESPAPTPPPTPHSSKTSSFTSGRTQ